MTTEEKAKAYDMALEGARKELGVDRKEWEVVQRVLHNIFSELTESEDERIMKHIRSYILSHPDSWGEFDRDTLIHWLEKQKELFESGRGLYYYDGEKTTFCGYLITEDNPYDFAMSQQEEKQKEHQNNSDAPKEKSVGGNFSSSYKDKNLDEIAQDYVDGVKEYNSEPTWDLMQTAVCYGYHYREQEEQKPKLIGEDSVEKMARQMYETGQTIEEQKPSDLPAGFYFIDQDGNKYYSKEFRYNNGTFTTTMKVKEEQKPVEQKVSRAQIHHELLQNGTITMEEYLKLTENLYFPKEQKPAEWSEEDDWKRKELIQYLEGKGDYRTVWMTWLKSLRPSWKPSEDEMKALQNAVALTACDKELVRLYNQLKKL